MQTLIGISKVVVALLLGATGMLGAQSIFTFDPDSGTATTFSDTNSGLLATFDSVELSPWATDFAIDNVDVATRATPEPASMALLGLGLTFLGVSARRRRQAEPSLSIDSTAVREGGLLVSGRRSTGLLQRMERVVHPRL